MPDIVQLFPIWILGTLVRISPIEIKLNWLMDLGFLFIFIYLANRNVNLRTQYFLGICIIALLLVLQNSNETIICKFEKLAKFFSDISFSL